MLQAFQSKDKDRGYFLKKLWRCTGGERKKILGFINKAIWPQIQVLNFVDKTKHS